jgi:hypothetical protein
VSKPLFKRNAPPQAHRKAHLAEFSQRTKDKKKYKPCNTICRIHFIRSQAGDGFYGCAFNGAPTQAHANNGAARSSSAFDCGR